MVVIDKTGTLTEGEAEVTESRADGLSETEVLALAAAVERDSEHPLAAAIVRPAQQIGAPEFRRQNSRMCLDTARWRLSTAIKGVGPTFVRQEMNR